MKRFIFGVAAAALIAMPLNAQRRMDKLDRGLTAVKTDGGIFASWRVFGEDADNVLFNLYRDGTLVNESPLRVSNFTDAAGKPDSRYTVKTVVNGIETATSKEATPLANDYLEIKIAPVPSDDYEPNDATIADLDGDGEMEVIIKLRSLKDIRNSYPYDATEFDVIHAYKLDGSLLWWISAGPNMVDFQSNELNIAAYDWDGDGRAECVLRGGDGMVIHQADGEEYVVGDPTQNTRDQLGSGGGGAFTRIGNEYLIYMDGNSGKPFCVIDYPHPRLEPGESSLKDAWGDEYGHRSNKHFFGAPYLDGRNPSIFIARGIYTRHKMIAYDVDPATHELKERWRWNCNDAGSPWFGQGYHNYSIADVDWDGRDEIVYGSMVIDDNGKGLSTTGLGHGDSHHVGDFNPYVYGSEIVACNESAPNNNYRDATTSKIYYRTTGGSDDGRAIAGNFTNDFPGASFITARDAASLISCVANDHIPTATATGDVAENFRIFWDGDLLDETFNYENGKNTNGTIYKYGKGKIKVFEGTMTNNDTKGTPCMQADIFGDWREEVIMRSADNKSIRIYTTTIPTEHRIYTLLHDPQYRNAMVWQMNGYNQTPHVSYFLGELEGITQAPPAPTMNGREKVAGTISGSGKELVFAETGDATADVTDGASPALFIDNAPSWVQGTGNNDNIKYEFFTHTLTGGSLAGDMKLVKLGGGELRMPDANQAYSGNTEIWDGSLHFNKELTNSHVWINRFGCLKTSGGKFPKGIEMNYLSQIHIGNGESASSIETSELALGFGAILNIRLFADGTADLIKAENLKIEKKTWENGPSYSSPVVIFKPLVAEGSQLPAGDYIIGEIANIEGSISDLTIEGLNGLKATLRHTDGKLILSVTATRAATDVVWTGAESGSWDMSDANNFTVAETGEPTYFVAGDRVLFNDDAAITDISIPEGIYPSRIVFNNNKKTFNISGAGIEGECDIEKKGTGKATLKNTGAFTGSISIYNGTLEVATLGANEGTPSGALGHYSNEIALDQGGILSYTGSGKGSHKIIARNGGIRVANSFTLTGASIMGDGILTKLGGGQLNLASACTIDTLKIEGGKVYDEGDTHSLGKNIVFNGRNVELIHQNSTGSYSSDNANYIVPKGKSGKLTLDGRCEYKGKLTGEGSLEVYAPWIRNYLNGDWSGFEGTLIATQNTGKTVNNYGSAFDFNSTKSLSKATLKISTGTTFNANNTDALHIGALAGEGTIGNKSMTLVIDGKGENTIFDGKFGAGVGMEKNGAEKLTLTGNNADMAKVTINQGSIELGPETNVTTSMLGSRAMTVKATLTGCGKLNNSTVTFTDGSSLIPINPNKSKTYWTIEFIHNLTMEPGSQFLSKMYDTKRYGSINVGGQMDLRGEVKVTLNGYNPKLDDEFVLWTAAESTGTPRLELPELPEGLYWLVKDVTPTEGRLKITDASGVLEIEGDMTADCKIYTLSGTLLRSFTSTISDALKSLRTLDHGIYILRYSSEGISRSVKFTR